MFKYDFISINTLTVVLYGVAFFIEQKTGFSFLLQIVGTVYLLLVAPYTLLSIFPFPQKLSSAERYLSLLIIFFCVYVPLYYFLNQSFHLEISRVHTFFINIVILLGALLANILQKRNGAFTFSKCFWLFFKKEYLFFGALLLFLLVHAVNYHFYGFIPEWDSYSDLTKIEQNLHEGFVRQSYRGLFSASAQILSNFSSISPYYIFSIVFIALQSSFIVVLRALLGRYKIQGWIIPSLTYIAAIAVPVINMEVDMVRPQNIFILLFPIFLYFAFRFLSEKQILFAILAGIIPIAGMNYHEFFIFPLFISVGYLCFSLLKNAYYSPDKKDRTIFLLIITCVLLFAALLFQKIGFIDYAFSTTKTILVRVFHFQSWRIWFLGNYQSDGETLQMGWPGISGALKYYAYYISPALLSALSFLAYSVIKRNTLVKEIAIRVTLPFIGVFLLFTEVLPRLNYLYLPERLWLPIDITLIFSLVPILLHLSKRAHFEKIALGILILFLVGIAGSFYVAANKKSLTSENEYRAAIWIRENTSEKSVFITQSANGPMISFFANRSILPIGPEYFLSNKIIEQSPEKEIEKLEGSLDRDLETVAALTEKFTSNELSFFDFADAIQEKNFP